MSRQEIVVQKLGYVTYNIFLVALVSFLTRFMMKN